MNADEYGGFFMKLIINGAFGKTGSALCRYIEDGSAHEVAAYVDALAETDATERRFKELADFCGDADCVIDFSHRSQTDKVCSYAVTRRMPLVIATTGQTDSDKEIIRAASRFIPVMCAANLSAGIAVLRRLVRIAVSEFPEADIEITEIHRRGKVDAPSGTALSLADEINAARPKSRVVFDANESGMRAQNEVAVHSLRLGDAAGKHTVYFALPGQTLALTHESFGRLPYAEGAVRAAMFLFGKKNGLYTERELFDRNESFF